MTMGEAPFPKHVYGRERKRTVQPLEDFDPRPLEFRGTAYDHLPGLLKKIRGEHLCISLLFDEHYRHWDSTTPLTAGPTLPDIVGLRQTVEVFKASLAMSDEAIRKVERDTKEQRNLTLWREVRRYRLTASLFGAVFRRQPETPHKASSCRFCNRNSIVLQQHNGELIMRHLLFSSTSTTSTHMGTQI